MNKQQLQDSLGFLLIQSAAKGKYGLLAVAEAHGLTLMQAISLCLIQPGDEVPMHYLTNIFKCDPSNTTSMVEHLVSCSLAERKECPKDRRVKRISLTKQGEKMRTTLLTASTINRLPNVHSLTTDELQTLTALLGKATLGLSDDTQR